MSDRDLRKELEELQNPDTVVDDILNLFRSWALEMLSEIEKDIRLLVIKHYKKKIEEVGK